LVFKFSAIIEKGLKVVLYLKKGFNVVYPHLLPFILFGTRFLTEAKSWPSFGSVIPYRSKVTTNLLSFWYLITYRSKVLAILWFVIPAEAKSQLSLGL